MARTRSNIRNCGLSREALKAGHGRRPFKAIELHPGTGSGPQGQRCDRERGPDARRPAEAPALAPEQLSGRPDGAAANPAGEDFLGMKTILWGLFLAVETVLILAAVTCLAVAAGKFYAQFFE